MTPYELRLRKSYEIFEIMLANNRRFRRYSAGRRYLVLVRLIFLNQRLRALTSLFPSRSWFGIILDGEAEGRPILQRPELLKIEPKR